ncbi:hypothetical protein [Asticcacaulis solisilvae]|uniref:hypothetical protein n=1 Tax=Asticcacaulis solisilvae TaxID=1217274 RepID=UPI003FD76A2B
MNRTLATSAAALSLTLALTALGAHAQTAPADGAQASSSAAALAAAASSSSAAAASPVAPAAAKLNDVPPPPAGKGQIVFFRPEKYVGWALSFSVHEGDKGVIKLTNGSYGVLVADPGVHEYSMSWETKDTLRLEVEEGETYYVVQSIAMGIIGARPNITPSTEDAFQAKKLNLTKAVATDVRPSN